MNIIADLNGLLEAAEKAGRFFITVTVLDEKENKLKHSQVQLNFKTEDLAPSLIAVGKLLKIDLVLNSPEVFIKSEEPGTVRFIRKFAVPLPPENKEVV